jgi:hypothetical protein
MQLVHFANPSLGSLDWELPPSLATALDTMPEEFRKILLAEIESKMQAYMHTLMGALKMGPFLPLAFALMDKYGNDLSEELIALCKSADTD